VKSAHSVRIELGPSRWAIAFVVATHLASSALVATFPVDVSLRVLAILAIGAHGARTILRSCRRSLGSSIVAAELKADRTVTLRLRDGTSIAGHAQPESYVGAWLTTVVVREDGRRRSRALLLWPDMADAEALREFRVLLRLGGRRS
jgi:hypothetical protein